MLRWSYSNASRNVETRCSSLCSAEQGRQFCSKALALNKFRAPYGLVSCDKQLNRRLLSSETIKKTSKLGAAEEMKHERELELKEKQRRQRQRQHEEEEEENAVLQASGAVGVSDQAQLDSALATEFDRRAASRALELDESRHGFVSSKLAKLREQMQAESDKIFGKRAASLNASRLAGLKKKETDLLEELSGIKERISSYKNFAHSNAATINISLAKSNRADTDDHKQAAAPKVARRGQVPGTHSPTKKDTRILEPIASRKRPNVGKALFSPTSPKAKTKKQAKLTTTDENESEYKIVDDEEEEELEAAANRELISTWVDDGREDDYLMRVFAWAQTLKRKNESLPATKAMERYFSDPENIVMTENGLKVLKRTWDGLLPYQRVCLDWLDGLHKMRVGGILGDEMGLGKTVQVVAFLSSLWLSERLEGPVLVVCPATVMAQWVHEFHTWFPPFRVVMLHGSGTCRKRRSSKSTSSDSVNGSEVLKSTLPLFLDKRSSARAAKNDDIDVVRAAEATMNAEKSRSLQQMYHNNYDSQEPKAFEPFSLLSADDAESMRKFAKKNFGYRCKEQISEPQRQLRISKLKKITSTQPVKKKTTKKRRVLTQADIKAQDPWVHETVSRVFNHGHILVTTFEFLRQHKNVLLSRRWGYTVLDEGHKIRNRNAAITIACKKLRCVHRLLLSGTPIQNNLSELWSLFDFVHPGLLGTFPVFHVEFSVPIARGGFANANCTQITTSHRCARTLRSHIAQFMLRRTKANVAEKLPEKQEKALFCRLSNVQERLYRKFLDSDSVYSILNGSMNALYGIDALRKICNHPLIYLQTTENCKLSGKELTEWQRVENSGKLVVVRGLLRQWLRTGHRALVFAQTRQTLDIIEQMVRSEENMKYLRMDGTTSIRERANLVAQFNKCLSDTEVSDEVPFVFLLTTRVGGLGISLIGADRVVIYDPDWNPCTDVQARERAWRIGQKRNVVVYRLLSVGTIEEKIYQRQIYKQQLSSKVLIDPRLRSVYCDDQLRDLFTFDSIVDPGCHDYTSPEVKSSAVPIGQKFSNTMTSSTSPARSANLDDRFNDIPLLDREETTFVPDSPEMQSTKLGDDDFIAGMMGENVEAALSYEMAAQEKYSNRAVEASSALLYAQQTADSALAALKKSAACRQGMDVSKPTWTGDVGYAGRPSAAPSSKDVLQALRRQQEEENMMFSSNPKRKKHKPDY